MIYSNFNDQPSIKHFSKKLFSASFRGVPFGVKSAVNSGGRRGPDHELVGRDLPYAEDIGRSQRKFTISAFVIGGQRFSGVGKPQVILTKDDVDYQVKRDALIEALEKSGPGLLIHPYLGKMTVQCREYTETETFTDGRMATFAMTFVEVGEQRGISPVASPRDGVISAGERLRNEMSKRLGGVSTDIVSSTGFLSFVDLIDGAMDTIDSGINKINAVIDSVQNARRAFESRLRRFNTFIAQTSNAIRRIGNIASDLARFPDQLAAEFQSNIEDLQNAGASAKSAFENLFSVIGLSDNIDDTVTITPSRTIESRNNRLFSVYIDATMLTSACDFATQIDYVSRDDAISVRDRILERLDSLIDIISDDLANPLVDDTGRLAAESVFSEFMYSLMRELRAQISSLLPDEIEDIPNISEFTVDQCENGLVSAYRQTGDAAGYSDLVARNNLPTPSAIQPNTTLKVLIDE